MACLHTFGVLDSRSRSCDMLYGDVHVHEMQRGKILERSSVLRENLDMLQLRTRSSEWYEHAKKFRTMSTILQIDMALKDSNCTYS